MNALIHSTRLALRPSLQSLYTDGLIEGANIILHNTPEEIAQEYHEDFDYTDCTESAAIIYAANCEESSRDFSPGEFLCKRINVRNDRDEAWDAYECGVRDGARVAYWAVYHLGLNVNELREVLL